MRVPVADVARQLGAVLVVVAVLVAMFLILGTG